MNQEIKDAVYDQHIRGYSNKAIAKNLNLSESTVSRAVSSVILSNDYKHGVKTAGMFIQDYIEVGDLYKQQLAECDTMLNNNLDDYLQSDGADEKSGRPYVTKAECMKIRLEIMEMIARRKAEIATLVRQGQMVQALQAIRNGKTNLEEAMKKLAEQNKS